MKVIDVHIHIFEKIHGYIGRGEVEPLSYGKLKFGTGEEFRALPPLSIESNFLPEVALEYMNWMDIEKAVILQGNFYGIMNDYVKMIVDKWPNRFIGAGMLDPFALEIESIFKRLTNDLGFKVIKLELSEQAGLAGIHPFLNLYNAPFNKLWKIASDNDIRIVIDLGPVGDRGYQIENLKKVIKNYPDLKIVFPHLGYPPFQEKKGSEKYKIWNQLISLGENLNIWFDLASLPCISNEEYPYNSAQKFIEQAYKTFGSEKLMWGSDIPLTLKNATYQQLMNLIIKECSFLKKEDINKIMGKNAQKFYGFCK
jgi:predicted TIM-barrel fold metal-dependent hydrolase